MKDFSDFLLDGPPKKDIDQKERVKILTSFYEKSPLPEGPSLDSLIRRSNQPPFACYFDTLDNLESIKAVLNNVEISFVICREISVARDVLKPLLLESKKPVWFVLEDRDEVSIIERRLQGFSGYFVPLALFEDVMSLQFQLEFGRDFGLESGICALGGGDLELVQQLDCRVVRVAGNTSHQSLSVLANTRCLVLTVEDDWDPNAASLNHKFGIQLDINNLDLDT